MNNLKIDDENRIHVLDRKIFKDSQVLKNDSLDFIKKVISFEESIKILTEKFEQMGKKVESEKLRALGEKSKLESFKEFNMKKTKEIVNKINEKNRELEKLSNEYDSLLKIENDQNIKIEKLINNQMD